MEDTSTKLITEFIFGDDAGDFNGLKIRIVNENPKKVSLYDVMIILGDINPALTLKRLKEKHKEVVTICYNFKFDGQGQKNTPVVDANGLIKILMILPGQKAAQFRNKAASILVRYLGGDLSLISEIENNNENQENNADNFGFRSLIININNLSQEEYYKHQFINPIIIDIMRPPNMVYLMWIGYDKENDINIYKYGETGDFTDRTRRHKFEQKSQYYILQICIGTHSTQQLQATIADIVSNTRIKLNLGTSVNKEIFACKNHEELKEIVNKIINICNDKYYKAYVTEIRIIDNLIDELTLNRQYLHRLEYQYKLKITQVKMAIKSIENNCIKKEQVPEDIIITGNTNVEITTTNNINNKNSILPIYPYDNIQQVDTLNEFVERYCILGKNEKYTQYLVYQAFTEYIKPTAFMGSIAFYNKIKKEYNLTSSTTLPKLHFYGLSLKDGVFQDKYIYVRDFLNLKCDFNNTYRVSTTDLFNSFFDYIKNNIKLTNDEIKTLGIGEVNFFTILKNNYPFKFCYIEKHKKGFCGIKLKSQNNIPLSELVKEFVNQNIIISEGNKINKRPVFRRFFDWYEKKYKNNDTSHSWTKTDFREEMQKYIKLYRDQWHNIKLSEQF